MRHRWLRFQANIHQFVDCCDGVSNDPAAKQWTDEQTRNADSIIANTPSREITLPQGLDLRVTEDYTPSPSSYQSALHGLLTLGTGSTTNGHAMAIHSHASQQPDTRSEPTLHDFPGEPPFPSHERTVDDVDAYGMWQPESQLQLELLPGSGRSETIPNMRELRPNSVKQHMSGHGIDTARVSEDVSSRRVPTVALEGPYWSEEIGMGQAEDDLTKLKIYRYQVAPWVCAL
jgi:hypothetical protein